MKKWLFALTGFFVIAIAAIYIFIPAVIVIKKSVPVTFTQEGIVRYLSSQDGWKKSWPGIAETKNGNNFYTYDGYNFIISKILYNSIECTIEKNKDTVKSTLFILPFQQDSLKLQWIALIHSGNNPFTRLRGYFHSKKLGNSLQTILTRMSVSLGKTETIYGLDIRKEKVSFQHFLATKTLFDHYPSTAEIYQLIGITRQYAVKAGANETDHPILNVKTDDSIHFETQVAIPIDKDIPGNEIFTHKWMMKGGNILAADVQGGMDDIKKANQQMTQYIIDYRRSVIAIPFQMLITDRTRQPDSSKWRTRLYYPVV